MMYAGTILPMLDASGFESESGHGATNLKLYDNEVGDDRAGFDVTAIG
jgi:hypothetical protein